MSDSDRSMAERVHAIVMKVAPGLAPRTWYGMPAYAKNGEVVCSDKANLDDGTMWATAFALTKLTKADEKRIADLVKRAVS
jgi:uncharacterized protein YdhG (YjbR/CyaY superfamily)